MSFVVVCFYTYDTPYAQEAAKLLQSCEQFDIPAFSYGYQSRGTWVKNAGMKPGFLLRMLQRHAGHDIVYLDADARVRSYPELFDNFSGEVGVHYRNGKELLSGTLYLKNVPAVHKLVKTWMTTQAAREEEWDQRVLQDVIKDSGVLIQELPASYCQIFDLMKQHGDPVIEHLQASRRFMAFAASKNESIPIPGELFGQRVRQNSDGTVALVRRNARAEAWLDQNADKIGPLKWRPKMRSQIPIEQVKPAFDGQHVWIVGKGPSLDYLTRRYFGEGPVIGLNEAIHKVESLALDNVTFGLQQDTGLRNTCLPTRGSSLFVSTRSMNFYADYSFLIPFKNEDLGLEPSGLSVSAALRIAKRLGATGVTLLCFDGAMGEDMKYASCVGYGSEAGGPPSRFLTHKAIIEANAQGLPLTWIRPSPPIAGAAYTPRQ